MISGGGLTEEDQAEWDQEKSPLRLFAALNEVLPADVMVALLGTFLVRVGASPRMLELLTAGAWYEAFMGVVEDDPARAAFWIGYVRGLFPLAPEGYRFTGRFANAPKKHEQGLSPRLWPLPLPYHHHER